MMPAGGAKAAAPARRGGDEREPASEHGWRGNADRSRGMMNLLEPTALQARTRIQHGHLLPSSGASGQHHLPASVCLPPGIKKMRSTGPIIPTRPCVARAHTRSLHSVVISTPPGSLPSPAVESPRPVRSAKRAAVTVTHNQAPLQRQLLGGQKVLSLLLLRRPAVAPCTLRGGTPGRAAASGGTPAPGPSTEASRTRAALSRGGT